MEERRKVLIDCDPGIDDSFALFLAMKHLDIVGITAVGGNTGLENTSRNARYLTQLAGRTDIPVYAGYDKPMFSKLERAEDVHGNSGMGDMEFEEPEKQLEAGHAVDFMVDTFMNQEHVTLVTLGPLTNVAQAILKEPRLKERIFEILCMGGSATAGNYNGCVEFNMAVDPEAAKIVFDSGIRIKMVGLNLCRQNSMTREDVAILEHMSNKVAKAAAELLEFSVNGDRQAQLCDACAISWLIDPSVITCALPLHVDVETKGEYTRGMTVCDYRDYIGVAPELDIDRTIRFQISDTVRNATVAMEFDARRFKKLLFDTLESYEK